MSCWLPWIAVVGSLSVAGAALAQVETRQPRRFALLVGVKSYAAMEKLKYTENDVEDLARVLVDAGGYRQVVIMTRPRGNEDPALEPTAINIRDQLKTLLATCKRGDTILLGFSGHGVQKTVDDKDGTPKKLAYFCPQDARPLTQENLLSLDDIYRQLEKCSAAEKFLFVDACRKELGKGGGGDDFEPEAPREGIVAFFSCGPNQLSHESDVHKHGFFFHHVIEGLKGGPNGRTRNAKGDVTPALLEEYLSDEVPLDVKTERKSNLVLQIPVRKGEVAGRVALVNFPAKQIPPPHGRDTLHLDLGNGVKMAFVKIKAGSFMMGSPDSDTDAFPNEKPQHKVTLTHDFCLGKYSVTREEFARFVDEENYKTDAEKDGAGGYGYNAAESKFGGRKPKYTWRNPGFDQTGRHPVVNVSWNDAKAFCAWFGRKTGMRCQLPTEAQWEYACRASTALGKETRYFTGDDPASLEGYANVADASLKRKEIKGTDKWTFFAFDDSYAFTSPVGSFKANAWALHDMTGNVWQWCSDWYGEKYYTNDDIEDPHSPNEGTARVLRGGSWDGEPRFCRAAFRCRIEPTYRDYCVGLRVSLRLD